MTDLTVLISPQPFYPSTKGFTFGRSRTPPASRPVMVTLETDLDPEADEEQPSTESSKRRMLFASQQNSSFLSPPVNTWKSPERARPRHRPTRSRSAPPERRISQQESGSEFDVSDPFLGSPLSARTPKRSFTAASSTRGGELLPPPPPLLRPTTFWRKTKRSGVTGASYSPASHLIRRSTYIAAGLTFDAPIHDLSALCVESVVSASPVSEEPLQLPASPDLEPPSAATLTTFDYWWPYPANPVPTSAAISFSTSMLQSDNGLIVSSSTPPQPTFLSDTISEVPSIYPDTVTPLPDASAPAIPSARVGAAGADQGFPSMYLVPVFTVGGILLLSAAVWFAYGCLTRKPREFKEDANLGGPLYIPVEEPFHVKDVERGLLPNMSQLETRQFQWPVRKRMDGAYGDEAGDPFVVPPLSAATMKLANMRRAEKSTRSSRPTGSGEAPSSPCSDTTSLEFLDLYESDEEGESRRREREVPWESLRHKSIKRGILEQVKKEGSWMDSVRAIAGSAFAGNNKQEEDVLLADQSHDFEARVWRRHGHVRVDSDVCLGDTGPVSKERKSSPKKFRTKNDLVKPSSGSKYRTESEEGQGLGGFRMAMESTLPPLMLAFGLGSQEHQEDRYSPMPIRGSPSQTRSRSSSPVKRTSGPQVDFQFDKALPLSPPRIMSPPLENSLCFTPTPASAARMKNGTRKPLSSGPMKKSRETRTIEEPLPFPGANSVHADVFRGRLMKPASAAMAAKDNVKAKAKAKAKDKEKRIAKSSRARPALSVNSSAASRVAVASTESEEGRGEVALRRVEAIMARSWTTREVEGDARGI